MNTISTFWRMAMCAAVIVAAASQAKATPEAENDVGGQRLTPLVSCTDNVNAFVGADQSAVIVVGTGSSQEGPEYAESGSLTATSPGTMTIASASLTIYLVDGEGYFVLANGNDRRGSCEVVRVVPSGFSTGN